VTICKTAFLRIHGVLNGRLCRVLKGQQAFSSIPKRDECGHHTPGNKTAEEDLELVKQHIESFPSYESHYPRKSNSHKKYLSPDLNITKMYLLYKEHCSETDKHPVSELVYRRVFNEDFNLSFGRYVLVSLPFLFHIPIGSHSLLHFALAVMFTLSVFHTDLSPSPSSFSTFLTLVISLLVLVQALIKAAIVLVSCHKKLSGVQPISIFV